MSGADVTGANGMNGANWLIVAGKGAIRDESNPSGAYHQSLELPGSKTPAGFMSQADLISASELSNSNQEGTSWAKGFWASLKPKSGEQAEAGLSKTDQKVTNRSTAENQEEDEGQSMRR